MIVRPLAPPDLERVLALNNAAVPAVGALDRPGLDHLVRESIIAVAACDDGDDDDIVGFCLVLGPGADYASVNYRWFGERYDDFVYLDRVAIDPASQGRGLGRALYDHVEAHVAQHVGAEWFCLEVNVRPRNDPSLAFHARLGFTEVGQQDTDGGKRVSLQTKRLR